MRRIFSIAFLIAVCTAGLAPSTASAFCGFYVGGAGAELFNDATQVALMRSGDRTVLSMQNRYDGPVEDFAMVIPVPVVLMEANVKTLDEAVFAKLDQLTAPRLVEYWEDDPCVDYRDLEDGSVFDAGASNNGGTNNGGMVTVEAQFKVGEYQIVILSATESTALETWLADNNYNVPPGAGPYYQPYIDAGMYFFVAQVDPAEVTFADGRAVLSPLRFDYASTEFSLPIRLGMINSAGTQDLIVYTLGLDQRYDVANYPNVFIPTNLEVTADTKNDFGAFYTALFSRTVKENPGAVVTEYSWNSATCDPCPGPTIDPEDLLTLGADAIGADAEWNSNWVVTRLHARYEKDDIGQDLVFRAADPVAGGREFLQENGRLEEGATPSQFNNFQGRYIIRHPWTGEIDCADPQFGRWGGGSASGTAGSPNSSGGEVTSTAGDTFDLPPRLVDDAPEIGVTGTGSRERGTTPNGGQGDAGGGAPDAGSDTGPAAVGEVKGNTCTTAGATAPGLFALLILGFFGRRRR